MKRHLAPLIFSLACSSANTTHHYHLDLAADDGSQFSQAQAQAIFDAASEWQSASDGFVTFDGQGAFVDVIVVHPSTVDEIVAEFGGGAIGYNVTSGSSSTIAILTTLDTQTFHQTALHELGHALGLVHTTPGNVMCANTTCATLEVTCGDLMQLTHEHVAGCFP
jgi:hypothetical protein